MPPANTTFATATTIGSLPFDFTQTDINDAGVNFTVYYRFVAPANSRIIGAWGFSGNISGGANYRPNIKPYNGPAGAPTQILGINFQNKPIQFPVVPGNEYFLEFVKNVDTAGPEDLRVRVEVAPLNPIAVGNILVNDDSNGFPLAILSHLVDHTVINFVKDFAFGEGGDILRNGVSAWERFVGDTIRVYSPALVEISNLAQGATGQARIRTCQGLQKFFLGIDRNPCQLKDILASGSYGAIALTMTGVTSMLGIAANNTGTILYYSNNAAGSAIKQWDIGLNSAMADLVAGIAGRSIVDILVLNDDSIVALYEQFGSGEVIVRRYNSAGTLLNTYSTVTNFEPAGTFARLAYALDNPTSFWRWHHPSAEPGISRFTNIRSSDGVTLTTRNHTEYEVGGYNQPETATPTSRFGNSFSCPFVIMTGGIGGIYFINPVKATKHDSYYGDVEKKIPNPLARTSFLGD